MKTPSASLSGSSPPAADERPRDGEGIDWVWRHWILQLTGGLALLLLSVAAMAQEADWMRFWYLLALTGGWLLVGVVNAAVSRGRGRWFVGVVLAMVGPFLVLIAAAESGHLQGALLSSSLLIMASIALCPRPVAVAVFGSGVAIALSFKATIGHLGSGWPAGYLVELTAAYAGLALLALAWRLYVNRLHEALHQEPPLLPVDAGEVAEERDRLREALIHHLRKVDGLLAQASGPAGEERGG